MDWLRVSSRRHEGWTVVEVSGELDVATGNQLGDHLEEVIAERTPARVVLDMSGLDFCDASGLSVLVAAHHAAKGRQGQLRLVCPQWRIRRLLHITELTDVMPVFDTVAQATATVKDREGEVLQPWPGLQSEVTS
ncbi:MULTISPECIES: STAS domain-containing protein [unclassified Streptomyces]|uniref:STAS domain-containing protein n=1 Tax=unclassified Streptomyces TaxID=2593676 RepID=UPI002257DFEC|nr:MULTISPECIES: STAS domain-containing protein [unclassified Streptomyces]MCX5443810.1 STAS domain-containing protein [Streptomyces sp. NBC_00063]WUB99194.1 STAS domain-containing protein [Streptomyces sp. NBC_00569]WUB99764.1 STAS domain-containing protein [Streptomyces sp. NBC_00569]